MIGTLNVPVVKPVSSKILPPKAKVGAIALDNRTTEIDIVPSSVELMTLPKGMRIKDSDYTLNNSLTIVAYRAKEGFVIKSDYVDEEVYGKDFNTAYADLITSIRDRYNSLKYRKKKLSQHDQDILKSLELLLEPK